MLTSKNERRRRREVLLDAMLEVRGDVVWRSGCGDGSP